MARTGQPSRERVAAASRSLAILDVLAAQGELGTNEIARRTGAVPSTVSRQLATLVESQLVEHLPEDGRHRLGIRLLQPPNPALPRLDVPPPPRPHPPP